MTALNERGEVALKRRDPCGFCGQSRIEASRLREDLSHMFNIHCADDAAGPTVPTNTAIYDETGRHIASCRICDWWFDGEDE